MRHKFIILCVNIGVFFLLLIGIEILGQGYYFLKYGYLLCLGKPSINKQIFQRHPFLGASLKKNILVKDEDEPFKCITTTPMGTRWTGAPQNDHHLIRVALLGGSTTFGAKVTDTDSWAALLQHKLGNQYAVINYGNPGYSSAENIIQLALLVPEKDPDIVIFYMGWNDIANYHDPQLGPDYYSQGFKQMDNNLGDEKFNDDHWMWSEICNRSSIFMMAHNIHMSLEHQNDSQVSGLDTPDPLVDRIYLRNLQTLKLLALGRNTHTKAIFIPQILNVDDFKNSRGTRSWSPYVKDTAMPALLDRFNKIMNNVCQPQESRCIVLKGVLTLNWQSSDFVDDGHFNRQGGLKFSQKVAEEIRNMEKP